MDILAFVIGLVLLIVGRKRETQGKTAVFFVGLALAVLGLVPFVLGFFGGFSSGFSKAFQEHLKH